MFPDEFKEARVFPVQKGGPSEDPSSYRPISILSIVSKLIEKHVTKHLFAYLNKYKLLHEAHSGFRKHHSCQTALINLINDWLNHIDKGNMLEQYFSTPEKLLKLLIMKYFCKQWPYIAYEVHLIAGLNHTFQTDLNVSWIG